MGGRGLKIYDFLPFGSWNDYFRFRWRLRVLGGYDTSKNIYVGSAFVFQSVWIQINLTCTYAVFYLPWTHFLEYWVCVGMQTFNPSIGGVSSHAIEEIKKIYFPAKQIQISMKNKIKKESTAYLKIFVFFCFNREQ